LALGGRLVRIDDASELHAPSERGQALYDSQVKPLLEPDYNGKWVAIHLDTGDYALGSSSPEALRALRPKRPKGM
jgi:hypothetical protein